jgi:hypothetical protein
MKISKTTLWSLLAISAVGLTVYAVSKKKHRKKLTRIADEGYEIAHDILFPDKAVKEKKLHYGPVLPE